MDCPNCQSSEHHRVVWGPRNLAAIAANSLWYLVQLLLGIWVSSGWSLKRRCLNCGYLFYGPKRARPDFDECAGCGYNLTGNVSGRCSECGWKLPRRYRIHRRRTDRVTSGHWVRRRRERAGDDPKE